MDRTKIERAVAQKSILTWAYKYRKIRTDGQWKPYNIKDYPFLKAIFHALQDPETEKVVLQKGTQIGATEAAITAAFYFLDVKAENVLYMLPNQGQLGDFAHSRLDKVIDQSPHLSQLFQDISNVGLKVSSRGSFYLRGANSSSQLEEFPAGLVIRDELSRMDQSNANLALKRLGSSENAWKLDLGHPTYEGDAISSEFADSTRFKWSYKCPNCGEEQPISFFDHYYERDKTFGCGACDTDWTKDNVLNQGRWVAQGDRNNPMKGFHISRILSPVETLEEIAEEYEDAKAEGEYKIAQFHQTVLGQPFSAEGDKLGIQDVKSAKTGQPMGTSDAKNTIMGVDTGKPLYWTVIKGSRVLGVGRATKFDQLHSVRKKYNVSTLLFDAQPEPHASKNFIDDLPPDVRGWMVRTKGTGDIAPPTVKRKDNEVKVHQVWMFDNLFEYFHEGNVTLPSDLPREAADHLTNPVRLIDEDPRGNPVPKYEKGECHFADALKFAFVGLEISDQVPTVTQETVFNAFRRSRHVYNDGRKPKKFVGAVQMDQNDGAYTVGGPHPKLRDLGGRLVEGDSWELVIVNDWLQPQGKSYPGIRHLHEWRDWLGEINFAYGKTNAPLKLSWAIANRPGFRELVSNSQDLHLNVGTNEPDLDQQIERIQALLEKDRLKIHRRSKDLIKTLATIKWSEVESNPLIKALANVVWGLWRNGSGIFK